MTDKEAARIESLARVTTAHRKSRATADSALRSLARHAKNPEVVAFRFCVYPEDADGRTVGRMDGIYVSVPRDRANAELGALLRTFRDEAAAALAALDVDGDGK